MKKLLLAISIALGGTAATSIVPNLTLDAEATSTTTFVKAMKKGTLPGAKGRVGMTYKQVKKKSPSLSKFYAGDPIGVARVGQYEYGFFSGSQNAKVQLVRRNYHSTSTISRSKLEKKIGKPYSVESYYGFTTAYYKSGKYSIVVQWRPSYEKMTTIIVSKKNVVDHLILT